jgi:sugar/nucleoside kinase (ribokinase family)
VKPPARLIAVACRFASVIGFHLFLGAGKPTTFSFALIMTGDDVACFVRLAHDFFDRIILALLVKNLSIGIDYSFSFRCSLGE